MKWYFALNESGILRYGEMVMVAVESATRNTSLKPMMLYDGQINDFTRWIESRGVTVVQHQVSFLKELLDAPTNLGFNPAVARGAYLRLEVPELETEDDFILYTDVDVIFVRNPDVSSLRPRYFAAAPEATTGSDIIRFYRPVCNSGAMIMNVKNMREARPWVLNLARSHNFYFQGRSGYYDQGAINFAFHAMWEEMPHSLNWRPFTGLPTDDASIIHFHGPKPHEVFRIMQGQTIGISDVAQKLYKREPGLYTWALEQYRAALSPIAGDIGSILQKIVPDYHGITASRSP